MFKNKKGFTLVELISILIILGIIALIAVPTIGKLVKSAKEKSFKASVEGLVKTAEIQCNNEKMDGKVKTKEYTFTAEGVTPFLDVNGDLPTKGSIIVDDKCNVKARLGNSNFIATKKISSREVLVNTVVEGKLPLSDEIDYLFEESNTYEYMGGEFLKGLQNNNFVWFNGNLFQIMGYDKNHNIRLISASPVSISPFILDSEKTTPNDFLTSDLKEWLNYYYLNTFNDKSLLKTTPFCLDVYNKWDTVGACTNYSESEDIKVSTISMQEFILSRDESIYESYDTPQALYKIYQNLFPNSTKQDFTNYIDENNIDIMNPFASENALTMFGREDSETHKIHVYESYLEKYGQLYFTLTPSTENKLWYFGYGMERDYGPGFGFFNELPFLMTGVRPIITISSDSAISFNGSGTEDSPFIIEDNVARTGKLIDNSLIGEYVVIDGKKYRIIDKTADVGTKILSEKVYEYVDESNWGLTGSATLTKLSNNSYLPELGLSTASSILTNHTWNNSIIPYSSSISALIEANPDGTPRNQITSYVGLPRLFEVYSYPTEQGVSYERNTWTFAWPLDELAESSIMLWAFSSEADAKSCNRPALMISKNVEILSGNGTIDKPYVIN